MATDGGFQTLMATGTTGPTAVQRVLIITGLVFAVGAAIITNVVLAARSRRAAGLAEGVARNKLDLDRHRDGLNASLTQGSFAQLLWAFAQVASSDHELFNYYYFATVTTYTQAGMSAIGSLFTGDVEDPEQDPHMRLLLEARSAALEDVTALQGLVDSVSDSRAALVQRSAEDANKLRMAERDQARYDQTSAILLRAGTSVQIISLVVVALKDLF